MKSFFLFLWEIFKIVVVALAIIIPIRYFLFQPFFVIGQSMEPNFENGDYLIVDEISYRFREPERGEVLVFRYPNDPSQRYIKRIIGLPGELVDIRNGEVFIIKNGETKALDESVYLDSQHVSSDDFQVILKDNEYFVMGDNRRFSSDSRRWGPLPRENIIGKVFLRAWPFGAFTRIVAPAY